jgi:ABC-type amino acid transport substrate-binding protein
VATLCHNPPAMNGSSVLSCGALLALAVALLAPPVEARTLAEIQADGKLTVAYVGPANAFVRQRDGEVSGFDGEVLTKVAQQLGLRVALLEVTTVAELLTALESGAAEVGAGGLGHTPERAERVHFTGPVTPQCHVAVTLQPRPVIASFAELGGLRIGTIGGSSWERAALAAGLPPGRLVDLREQSTAPFLAALRGGRIDAAVTGLFFALAMQSDEAGVRIGAVVGQPGHHAYAVRRSDRELLARLDATLTTLRGTRLWYQMARQHFGAAAPESFALCRGH